MKKSMHTITLSAAVLRISKIILYIALLGFLIISFTPESHARTKKKPAKKEAQPAKPVFEFKNIVEMARNLSAAEYDDPRGRMPKWLLEITYDQLRDIRFIPDKSYWRKENLPFELQFFHAGLYFDRTVKINEILPAGPVPIKFSSDFFVYEKSAQELKAKIPQDLGFAGFRIHCNLNNAAYKDEVAVFLGASYFRAVAKSMQYGLSARGLAVDTAVFSGEEFPWFREFWIKRPAPGDTTITVYALLDSQRVTGAYSFVIIPGRETLMDTQCTIFLRKAVDKLGIAPMTSMFFYGENVNIRPKDWFRPEIHDSDGLMIHMENGEWLWRPLFNPKLLWVNAFQADNPAGFGLIQRDLNFDHYQDLEARYDFRPSLWCTPKGKWGKGWVELVQIPTDDEIHDNIAAFWRPAAAPVGQPLSFAYTLSWHYPDTTRPPAGRVVATRTETPKQSGVKKFIVDFEGGELEKLKAGDPVEGIVNVGSGGRLIEQQIYKNTVTGGWRLVFIVKPESDPNIVDKIVPDRRPLVEMRAFLRHKGSVLTETWTCGAPL
jgi:periplasmic glucans biosynthesis protein